MEEEQILDNLQQKRKVYKEKMIYVGTFLGGPLVAGYMMAENFKAFNDEKYLKQTWLYTIVVSIIIFGTIFMIPDTVKLPNQIIPLIYLGITYHLVRRLQAQKLIDYLAEGGKIYSWWRATAVILISLAIILIFGFVIVVSVLPEQS